MLTLSYGYKKPENADTGDVWFPAMAANMQRLNDHSHDGSNSAPLATTQVQALAANWSAVAGSPGTYRQTITVPTGLSYDTADIWVHLSTGEMVYPTTERIGSGSFYVYSNDNSVQFNINFR